MLRLLLAILATLSLSSCSLLSTKVLAETDVGPYHVTVFDKACASDDIKTFAKNAGASDEQVAQLKDAKVSGEKELRACVYVMDKEVSAGIIVDETGDLGVIALKKK